MPINLIKREIQVPATGYTDTEDLFYVMWNRDPLTEDDVYYLVDLTDDGTTAVWTRRIENAIAFTDGKEALEFSSEVKRLRRNCRIELKIVSGDQFDFQWG